MMVAVVAHAERYIPPTPASMPAAKAKVSVAAAKAKALPTEDDKLLELTNDPVLGNADRISGEEVRGLVTFTFDDGPNPGTTDVVVDALQQYNIPALFFIVTKRLVGKDSEAPRALLAQMLDKGFLVASHSVTHRKLRRASATKLAAEIDESIRILSKEAARPIGMFRVPFGAIDDRAREWLKKRRLTETFWSIDTRDWEAEDPAALRNKVFEMIVAQDGGVVLMHDVKPITAGIVADVLDDLELENCTRLEYGRTPIWPVSIHYFLRDNKQLRPIPDNVKKTTDAYRLALPARCAARAPRPPYLLRPLFLE